jgi:hypothetical protein
VVHVAFHNAGVEGEFIFLSAVPGLSDLLTIHRWKPVVDRVACLVTDESEVVNLSASTLVASIHWPFIWLGPSKCYI